MKPLQVLVVDLNVGFSQKGSLFSPRVAALIEPAADFLRNLPAESRVIFVSDRHELTDPELRRFPWHCGAGTGEEFVRPELIAACNEAGIGHDTIYKIEHEAFIGSDDQDAFGELVSLIETECRIADSSRNGMAGEWIVIGCVTDICIESNVGALVMRGRTVTVVRNLIDTYDLPLATCRELGLPDSSAHDAEAINKFWFEHRFPAVWGARVVQDWRELTGETA